MTGSRPKASIVTPCLDAEAFIEETIESVNAQTYPDLEHIVVDGGSEDGTLDVLRAYEDEAGMRWVSEPDGGMYEAIEKGFDLANGELLAWLNADDRYLPWAVSTAVEYLAEDADWVTGVPAFWDTEGRLSYVASLRPDYKRSWIRRGWYRPGIFGAIQQESCFWTRELWDRVSGFPDDGELAGDFHLWRRFAEHAELVTIPTVLAGFRRHRDQLSTVARDKYMQEVGSDHAWLGKLLALLRADDFYSLVQAARTRVPAPRDPTTNSE